MKAKRTFKDYFKFPLELKNPIMVNTSDSRRAFDFFKILE